MTTTTIRRPDPLSAATPDVYLATLASVRHLCQSPQARDVYEGVARFATWEPWDVAEYFDGEVPHAAAACRAAYLGDRAALIAAMRALVAERQGRA